MDQWFSICILRIEMRVCCPQGLVWREKLWQLSRQNSGLHPQVSQGTTTFQGFIYLHTLGKCVFVSFLFTINKQKSLKQLSQII